MSGSTADWNTRYAASPQLFGDRPSPLLTGHRALLRPGMRVLAIGDGEGRNGVWLAAQGLDVLSVDQSTEAQARARARADALHVPLETQCVDVTAWEWPQAAFDAIVCIFVHFPSTTRPAIHRAIIDALRPGGLLILEVFHRDQIARGSGGPSDPDLLYTTGELAAAFSDCEILLLEQAETDVEVHGECKGRGSVVHLIARRPSSLTPE